MMTRVLLVCLGLALCLWRFGGATLGAEDIRQNGEDILFELAPVDPRALFLGDYMALRYDLGDSAAIVGDEGLSQAPETLPGTAVIQLDDQVGTIVRYDRLDELAADERLIRFVQTDNGRDISIGGERYYFQSGTAERYQNAEYGIFRVMPDGRALLSGLADEKKRPILIAGEAPSNLVED